MPELICDRCKQNYPAWFTDNDLWNKIICDNPSNFVFHFLCPTCFCFLGEHETGSVWHIHEEAISTIGMDADGTKTSKFEELFWQGKPNGKISSTLKLEYEIAKEWWLKAIEIFKKEQEEIQSLRNCFDRIVKRIEQADQQDDRDKAAQLHEERREIRAKLKKLGVEVTS